MIDLSNETIDALSVEHPAMPVEKFDDQLANHDTSFEFLRILKGNKSPRQENDKAYSKKMFAKEGYLAPLLALMTLSS